MSSADAPSDLGDGFELDDDDELELACSSCNADLTDDQLYRSHRICSHCRRHFWIAARERLALLLDPSTLHETNAELASIEPLRFRDRLPVADRLAEEREQSALADAVVTGTGEIGGCHAIVIALDLAIFGAGVGIVAGEKIALAIELAVNRRLPVIVICSAGAGRGREGVLALAQAGKLAASAARLRRVGVPLFALITHPTSGNVVLGIANQADFCFAEPGAHSGLGGGTSLMSAYASAKAEELVSAGAIDGVLDRTEQRRQFGLLLRLLADRWSANVDANPPTVATEQFRASKPVTARDWIRRVAVDFTPLRGDRLRADSEVIAGGIASVAGATVIVLATDRTAGALDSAAFAKINRLLRLAAHLELPVVSLVETPGAGDEVDSRTELAMAQTLALLVSIPVPIVCVVTGEASGLKGTSLTVADRVLMLDDAVIALASGDQIATARDCFRLGIVDSVIPTFASASNSDELAARIGAAVHELAGTSSRRLIDERARRLRQVGLGTAESRAVAHLEWHELQEMQRAVGRTLGELRRRWEHRQLSLPDFSGRPSRTFTGRPSLPPMNFPKLTIRRPDFANMASRMATTRKGLLIREPRERIELGDAPDDK
jgi:acetyl-CoA carboxylase beta subunit